MSQPDFLPTTREEMNSLGWDELDILLVSGDAYVDSHAFGASLLGRWLLAHGYKAGIVAQPNWENTADVSRMGRPRLFAGVTAGAVDSLLAHYTAFRKKRHDDAYSPGGRVGLRPNRATIAYTGIVRQAFPGLAVVAGGIEASLRRASHYDFWSDNLRRSIVLDSKVDVVLYGMAEKSILALSELFSSDLARQRPGAAIARARLPGTAYAAHPDAIPGDAEELPSHEAIAAEPALLIKATMAFERQMLNGGPVLVQRSGGRAVVFEPPAAPLAGEEMDRLYGLPFTRRAHPSYDEPVPAVTMLEGSVVSHRGCGGGCSFCALASHQGRLIQSRSEKSLVNEIQELAAQPGWKGSITDIGGPTSNMWNSRCEGDPATCKRESCMFPKRCRNFRAAQDDQAALLRKVREMDGVKHVRVASGVRHDLALESDGYLEALIGEFTGGQLKIAPEHISEKVLRLMRKPPVKLWETFLKRFGRISEAAGKEQYIVPYLMSAFPGSTDQDMEELAAWLRKRGWRPQQVQCFIPTPGTVATAMFYAGVDTEGRAIKVARSDAERLRQHRILVPEAEPPPARAERPARGDRPGRPYPSRERGGKPPFRRDDRGGGKGGFAKRDAYPRRDPAQVADGAEARPVFSGRPERPRRDDAGRSGPRQETPGRPYSPSGRPPREGGKPRASGGGKPSSGGRAFSGDKSSSGGRSFSGGKSSSGGRSFSGDKPSSGGRSFSGGKPGFKGRSGPGGKPRRHDGTNRGGGPGGRGGKS